MKSLAGKIAAIITTALISNQGFTMDKDKELKLFSRPLILGASVSRGFGTTDGGPGTVISKIINPKAVVTNKSMSGHTSVESAAGLNYFDSNPSIVLALDLFFWDAARDLTGSTFESNAKKLFKSYQDKNIPMIVGKVPVGVRFPEFIKEAGSKKSAVKINKFLEEQCTLDKNCLLYDPKICFDMMGSPVSPEGVNYFSDSMHTTNEGNLFCANIFVKSGLVQKLKAI
jgi:hypothetical protein